MKSKSESILFVYSLGRTPYSGTGSERHWQMVGNQQMQLVPTVGPLSLRLDSLGHDTTWVLVVLILVPTGELAINPTPLSNCSNHTLLSDNSEERLLSIS